jgi:peptidyl-prolyl cis-trans isomerase C/peptidyl-prolyl cis-trans isomerase D
MKKETISRVTLTVIFFVAGALGAKAIQAATELARVNGTVITLQDFEKKYKDNLKFFQFKAPTKKNMLDDIIKREIGIQEAKKMGLDKDPDVVERMHTVLYQAFLDKKLAKQFDAIQVTDDEAKDFYAKNPEIRTSHIFVAVRPDAKSDDVKKAYATIKEIQDKHLKSMGFAEVAQKFSEGGAAPMGGDIDWQTRDRLDPKYYETAVGLSVGGVSGIVRSQFGYHIIKLTGKKSWDEVDRPMIKRIVYDERRAKIFEGFMTQLRNQAKVVVNAELLKE